VAAVASTLLELPEQPTASPVSNSTAKNDFTIDSPYRRKILLQELTYNKK
jgi:hypothetical protein